MRVSSVLHVVACARLFLAAFKKCLFKRYWNLKVLQFREIVFRVISVIFTRRLHRSRPFILGTLGRGQKVLRLDALR